MMIGQNGGFSDLLCSGITAYRHSLFLFCSPEEPLLGRKTMATVLVQQTEGRTHAHTARDRGAVFAPDIKNDRPKLLFKSRNATLSRRFPVAASTGLSISIPAIQPSSPILSAAIKAS
jgi:hypothetical protein